MRMYKPTINKYFKSYIIKGKNVLVDFMVSQLYAILIKINNILDPVRKKHAVKQILKIIFFYVTIVKDNMIFIPTEYLHKRL